MFSPEMSQRNSLLYGSPSALVATGGLGSSRRLLAQTYSAFDPSVLDSATSTHAAVISRSWNGVGIPNDFLALSQAQHSVATTMISNNFDAQFKSQIANVQASQLNPANNDYSGALQRIQAYAPDFALADFQQLQNYLPSDPSSVARSLADLQQNGLSSKIQAGATYYAKLQQALNLQNPDGMLSMPSPFKSRHAILAKSASTPSQVRSAIYSPVRDRAHLQQVSWQRAFMTLNNGDGGGTGYTCADDGAAGLAYATAIAVVTAMCFFSVIGDVLCLPVFLFWAGTAGAGWALGHAVKCGF